MAPRTFHQSDESTRSYYEDCQEGGNERVQTGPFEDQIDECSALYGDDSSLDADAAVVYRGGVGGSDEKLGIPVNGDVMDTSNGMLMLTFSDEASVSTLEESYIEGDSWSTIEESEDEANEKNSDTSLLLSDVYNPDEADRVFIFTDEETSPRNAPLPSQDLEHSHKIKYSKSPRQKIARKLIEKLNRGGRKSQSRSVDSISTKSDASYSDEYSYASLRSMDRNTSSGSSSSYSDQWMPRKYKIWSRRKSSSSVSSFDSDELCSLASCETPGFLSRAVKSMRRQRRRRHSAPVTSLLDSVNTSLSTFDLDNIQIDKVSSWEEDNVSIPGSNAEDKYLTEKCFVTSEDSYRASSSVSGLKSLLGKKGEMIIRNDRRKGANEKLSPNSSTGSTFDSTSNYEDWYTDSFNPSEEVNLHRPSQKPNGISILDKSFKGRRFSEGAASSQHGIMTMSAGNSSAKQQVYSDAKYKDKSSRHYKQTDPNYYEYQSMVKEECAERRELKYVDRDDTTKSKERANQLSLSESEARTHSIEKKRIKRKSKSKSKKRSSRSKNKLNRKRRSEEKPRSSYMQVNAVSLQSGTAPWSPYLIRSVTPISTSALDARASARDIAVSLGLGKEADEILTILSEKIGRQKGHNLLVKEAPVLTCIRLTRDLYIPNFGLYTLQSIGHFKQSLHL